MRIKDMTQRAVRRTGYILQRWPPEGSLDREVQRLIAARCITTVIDIGAHVGHYGSRLRALGFTGRIVSFEPAPEPFARLRNALDDRWEAHQLAVSDRRETVDLHIYSAHEEFASLHMPSEVGRAEWGLASFTTTQVRTTTLDDCVSELNVDARTALVKIDTQGHDSAVMRGGIRTLAAAGGLQMELPTIALYEASASFTDLFQQARDFGFALLGVYPVHAHPRPLIPIEFDGLFARAERSSMTPQVPISA